MIKSIEVHTSVVYDFILSLAKLNNYESAKDIFETYGDNILEKIKLDEQLAKWLDKTKEKLPYHYLDIMDFFFNGETRWFALFVYYIRRHDIQHIDEFISFIENKSGQDLLGKHLFLFSHHFESFPKISEQSARHLMDNQQEATMFLDKTDFTSKRKWEFIQFILNPKKKIAALVEFLNWYKTEIFNEEIEKVKDIIEKYENELESKLNKYGEEYLKHLVNTDYSKEEKDRTIVLSISYYSELGYLILYMDYKDEHVYILGFRHMEVFVERRHGTLSNVHIFKALGDETRQNLIKLLSQKEWYGDELAREMELSNSTVSYHLNILLLEGFVRVNRIDNRRYYTLNKENLQETIHEALERMIRS